MGVRSRSKRRRRRRRENLSLRGRGDGIDDLISELTDDLLVRILDLVPDARDVVRTDILSRRWRGLWMGVATLNFNSDRWRAAHREVGAAKRYLAFVDNALTLCAKAMATTRCYAGIKDLKISLDISDHKTEELVPPCFKAAQGWIRYVMQHEVKSIALHMYLPLSDTDSVLDEEEEGGDENVEQSVVPTMALDDEDLASSTKLETMHLNLGGAKLRLPFSSSSSTVVFSSLTDVSLEDINNVAGHLLSRLVSPPCCPCLRKLLLKDIFLSTMEELLLEGDALLEISINMIDNMQSLKLRTPSLRVLRVELCFDLKRFTVFSAPRLEDLMFKSQKPLRIVDVHSHLSSVGTLKIPFYSCGYLDGDNNDTSIRLLQCCRLTKCLEISLQINQELKYYRTSDIIKWRIPSLPHVTSLSVQVRLRELHTFAASVASFLSQCNNIRYLSLEFHYWDKKARVEQDILCDNSCQWKSLEFSLAHLQDVKFKKLIGTDCELQFIQSILKRETGVQNVAISFNPYYWIKDNKDAFKLMPSIGGGSWTTCNNADLSYKWRRYCA